MKFKKQLKIYSTIFVCLTGVKSWSHGGEDHNESRDNIKVGLETVSKKTSKEQIAKINKLYLKNIKPIFKKKCLDCHGKAEKLPWYASVPGPKQLIEHDIEEAQEHMNMTLDFPFSGHADAKSDLESLKETIEENEMPPLKYKIMHWNSGLTETEKSAIQKWVVDSLNILKN